MKRSQLFIAVTLLLAAAAHAADSDEGVLDEITVTAQKRSQSLQDVPMSISALDEKNLQALGAKNFEDFAREIPGIAFANLGPGENRFTIRGVSTFSGTSVVGIYLDDSPIASTINYSQPSLALYDVQRVEVLKGPQGTLYGEGSLGGTLRYITADPDVMKFAAKTEATVSNTVKGGTNYDVQAAVNLPVVENELALRLVGVHQHDSGYIDNLPLHDNDFNDITTDAFRGKALWKATEDLSIQLTGLYQKIAQGGPNVESLDAPARSLENLDTAPQSYADKLSQGSVKITYDFPLATLTSATSYFAREVNQNAQSRGYAYNPPFPFYTKDNIDFHVFTEEARATSKGDGPLQWVGGVYFNQYHVTADYSYFDTTAAGESLGATLQDNQFKQYAVFGELEYAITRQFFATTGVRWYKENQDAIDDTGTRYSVSSNVAVPRVALRYVLNPQAMVYASATEGFRSGGVNLYSIPGVNNTYSPDKTWNYELGTRLTSSDRRASIDLAVYHIDWRDLQTFVARPDLGPFVYFIENVSAAKVDGAELQLDWKPEVLRGLAIGGNGSLSNARYTKDAPFEGPAGNKLPQVPRWTASAYTEYRLPLTVSLEGYGRFDYQYQGTAFTLGNNLTTIGNYSLGNLKVGVQASQWSAELFANNLWDTRASLYQRASTEYGIYRNRPATYGLTLRWNY